MRLKSVRIKNFRGFKDEFIALDPYTCLVGANGCGKSTVLCALNIFFKEASNSTDVNALSAEDFHGKNTSDRIEITVTFAELSKDAEAEFQDYVRHGELIVSAIASFDDQKGYAPVKQVGSRLGMAEFAPFFQAYKAGAPASELAQIYDTLSTSHPALPSTARSKDAKRDALIAFEKDAQNAPSLVALESEDHFYGIAGNSKLRSYVQWVYVPAVKDATQEQSETKEGALGKLLARTVRARVAFRERIAEIEAAAHAGYAQLLRENQHVLDDVAGSLSRRLGDWSHPDVSLRMDWTEPGFSLREPGVRVVAGETGFDGDLSRFGHGFQRSYLLALLQELAATNDKAAPTLILGCEEAELYQHPPQARYLATVMQALAERGEQVILTTHSPYFVRGSSFESVRMIKKGNVEQGSSVRSVSFSRFAERYAEADEAPPVKPEGAAAQIGDLLTSGLNEMFFATRVVLVEGSEDVAYIATWAGLTGRLDSFRQKGIHLVPVGGKDNLTRPVIIAQELGIPYFAMFDGDRSQHERPQQVATNKRLLRSLDADTADLFPRDSRWADHYVQWRETLSEEVDAELSASIGEESWRRVLERARALCGHARSLEKNSSFVQQKLTLAFAEGARSSSLETLCERISGIP